MPHKSTQDLDTLLAYWQSKLNLPNWRIRIAWESRLPELVRGRCFWEGGFEDAMILINPRKKIWTKDYPVERTIIHELLHLHLAPGGDPCPEYIETAVRNLTTTIWNLRKEKQKHAS